MTTRVAANGEGFARRDFLRIGVGGLFGLGLPQLLELEARGRAAGTPATKGPQARSVILVWLNGGPSTIDTWDMKPDTPDGIRGEFKPIATRVNGLRVCEHLPQMAKIMDKCTLVRSLAHTIPEHTTGTSFMITGNRPTPVLRYPALGSLAMHFRPSARGTPAFVAFRDPSEKVLRPPEGVAGYLGPAYEPFELEVMIQRTVKRAEKGTVKSTEEAVVDTRGVTLPSGFTLTQLEDRNALVRSFDRRFEAADHKADLADGVGAFHQQALDILRSRRTRDALDLRREAATVRERYGHTPFGHGCLGARRLVEAGARFVTVNTGPNWDTHGQNFGTLRTRNLPRLDQALSALIQDLDDRGLLKTTIVYCAGEFGRTPKVNKNAGRDHWARSMAVLLAGGGFGRGLVYGSTDAQGMAPARKPCAPDDIAATIVKQLGIDPHQELPTPSGRPVQLFREGRVLSGLLG